MSRDDIDTIVKKNWMNYLSQFDLPAVHFQDIPSTSSKYCVIIEPRIDPRLPLVIKNFAYLLQRQGWGMIVVHGNRNGSFIKAALEGWKTVHYVAMPVDNLTISEYNTILSTPLFWETLLQFGCYHALCFEIDALLLKGNVDDFLQYDYIGAPWITKWLDILEVGNSGFCLRRTQKMLEITRNCSLLGTGEGYFANDIYFSYWCLMLSREGRCNIPTVEVASEFSSETILHEASTGLHNPHINEGNIEVLLRMLWKKTNVL